MKLEPLLKSDMIFVMEDVSDKDTLINRICDEFNTQLSGLASNTLKNALVEREAQGATSTPEGVAFPHAMLDDIQETFIAACLLKPGVDFGVKDHPVSDLVFVLVGPRKSAWTHISILARLARICHSPGALDSLRSSDNAKSLYDQLIDEDRKHG